MRTLLIATVGGQVGRGVIEAIADVRDRIRIVGVNSVADAPANFLCDSAYLVPGTAELFAWLARMREILRVEQPAVVLAGRDEDMAPLAILKQESEFAAALALNPGAASAAVVNDKYSSYQFARQHSLPFVDTAVTAVEVERMLAVHGLPLIVKPRTGSDGKGVRALVDAKQVESWLGVGGMAFQPFIGSKAEIGSGGFDPAFGQPMVFAAPWRNYLCGVVNVGAAGEVTCRGLSRLEISGRTASRHTLVDAPAIERAVTDFGAALAAGDFAGPVVVQGRPDGAGRFLAFELNGRITAGLGGRARLGVEELGGTLDVLLGPRPSGPGHAAMAGSAVVMRPDWELTGRDDVARLQGEGVWHRAPAHRPDACRVGA